MIWHTRYISRSLDAMVVGKVKDRVLVKLGDHLHLAVAPCGSHMLAESIRITAGRRIGHRGQEFQVFNRLALTSPDLSIKYHIYTCLGQRKTIFPISQKHAHITRKIRVDRFHIIYQTIYE